MLTRPYPCLLIMTFTFVVSACSSEDPDKLVEVPTPPLPTLSASDQDLKIVGEEIVRTFQEKDYEAWAELLDMRMVIGRGKWPEELSETELKRIDELVETDGQKVYRKLIDEDAYQDSQLRFVGVSRPEGRENAAIIRCRYTDLYKGPSYMEFVMGERDGRPVIADINMSELGQSFSSVLRLATALDSRHPLTKAFDIGTGAGEEMVEAIEKMQRHMMKGNPKKALVTFNELPRRIRMQEMMQIIRMEIAYAMMTDPSNSPKEQESRSRMYERVLLDAQKKFPDTRVFALHLHDFYLSRKEANAALKIIDELDHEVEDPYLNSLRARVYAYDGNVEKARLLVNELIDYDSTLAATQYTKIIVGVAANDLTYASEAFNTILDLWDQNEVVADLEMRPDFRAFVNSDEYRQVKGAHGL